MRDARTRKSNPGEVFTPEDTGQDLRVLQVGPHRFGSARASLGQSSLGVWGWGRGLARPVRLGGLGGSAGGGEGWTGKPLRLGSVWLGVRGEKEGGVAKATKPSLVGRRSAVVMFFDYDT